MIPAAAVARLARAHHFVHVFVPHLDVERRRAVTSLLQAVNVGQVQRGGNHRRAVEIGPAGALLNRLGHVLVILDFPALGDDAARDGDMVGHAFIVGRLNGFGRLARGFPLDALVIRVGVLGGIDVAKQAVLAFFLVAAFIAVEDRDITVVDKRRDVLERDAFLALQFVILRLLEELDGEQLVPLVVRMNRPFSCAM